MYACWDSTRRQSCRHKLKSINKQGFNPADNGAYVQHVQGHSVEDNPFIIYAVPIADVQFAHCAEASCIATRSGFNFR